MKVQHVPWYSKEMEATTPIIYRLARHRIRGSEILIKRLQIPIPIRPETCLLMFKPDPEIKIRCSALDQSFFIRNIEIYITTTYVTFLGSTRESNPELYTEHCWDVETRYSNPELYTEHCWDVETRYSMSKLLCL